MKSYEIGYLTRTEEGVKTIREHLKRADAEILFESEVRNLKLSYPVLRLSSAYFGYIHFNLSSDSVKSLNDALKLENQAVRFLIVTPPFPKDKRQEPLREAAPRRRAAPAPVDSPESGEGALTNDLLEEKLEEILNK